MNVPKLSPAQWFRLVVALLPYLRTLVKATGLSVVTLIRTLVDIVARVESLFPADPNNLRLRRGSEKAAAFAELVRAAFETADDAIEATAAGVNGAMPFFDEVGQVGAVIVELFNQWRIFPTSAPTPTKD